MRLHAPFSDNTVLYLLVNGFLIMLSKRIHGTEINMPLTKQSAAYL